MSSQSLPPTRIDLHSHLLPDIDDGCQTFDESLACIRSLQAAGFAGSVCTPHFGREIYPKNTPQRIAAAVEELSDRVAEAGLRYRLWPGAEVRLARSSLAWFEEVGVPVLGEGTTVLVDYWGWYWPDYGEPICAWLLDRGYQVLLAHPERMEFPPGVLGPLLARLAALGVRLQGNLNSLAGGEGPAALALGHELLDSDRYWVLASDAHGPAGLERRLAVCDEIAARRGHRVLEMLLAERTRAIVSPAD